MVINLRYLNRFLRKEKFKYEDLRLAMLLFRKGDYAFTFDLKSAYHHIDIESEHWTYLGFHWTIEVLPFGLTTACFTLT